MVLFAFASALGLSACKGVHFNEENSYGLKLVSLKISPEEHGLLNGQLLSKRPAQVQISLAGEFKVNCSASYAGRSSLDSYRKSYDLNFCDESYNKRSHYRLSAQAIDKTMVRSLVGYGVFKFLGLEVPKAEPATAYINKKYLGLYVFMETINKEFFKARKVGIEEMYKARYGNASFRQEFASRLPEAFSYDGKGEDNYVLIESIYKMLWLEPRDDLFVEQLEGVLDMDSFLSYMATALFINHWDGFDNNYFLVFDTDKKKMITVPWDLDRIWEKPSDFKAEDLLVRNELLTRLLKVESYHDKFVAKVAKLLAEFPVDRLILEVQKRQETAREAYGQDPILSRYQTSAFAELEQNIRIWDLEMKAFVARYP